MANKKELKESDLDARDRISLYLKDRGIMRKWLAKKLGLSNTHITLVLQKERDLTDDNLKAINKLLGTSF